MSHMRKHMNESSLCFLIWDLTHSYVSYEETYEWVISCLIWENIEMSHLLYDTSEEATAQSGLCLMRMGYKLFRRDTNHLYVTWLVYMGHDSFVRVTLVKRQWRNQRCASCEWDTRCLHVTCLMYTWHDSFIRDMTHSYETWLIHMCDAREAATAELELCLIRMEQKLFRRDMTHLYVMWLFYMWHDLFVGVTQLSHVCDTSDEAMARSRLCLM